MTAASLAKALCLVIAALIASALAILAWPAVRAGRARIRVRRLP